MLSIVSLSIVSLAILSLSRASGSSPSAYSSSIRDTGFFGSFNSVSATESGDFLFRLNTYLKVFIRRQTDISRSLPAYDSESVGTHSGSVLKMATLDAIKSSMAHLQALYIQKPPIKHILKYTMNSIATNDFEKNLGLLRFNPRDLWERNRSRRVIHPSFEYRMRKFVTSVSRRDTN